MDEEKILKEVVNITQKDSVNQEELFSKVQEFLDAEETEYPNFALTTMIMDSFVSGASIFKVVKQLEEESPVQEKFLDM